MSALGSYIRRRGWRRGLTPGEYRALNLAALPAAQAKQFIGAYGAARLALCINRLSNQRGLVADKLLLGATLRGAGLNAPDVRAVFGRPAPPGAERLLSPEDLRRLLNRMDDLPLFGKPVSGQRAGGEIAVFGYDDEVDDILTVDGERVPVPRFWDMLQQNHRSGG